MDLIRIFCLIGLLPAIYPIKKIFNRQALNIFDLIILFHSLNYCLAPILSNEIDLRTIIYEISEEVTLNTFLFYFSFITLILITDIYWTTKKQYKFSLINLSDTFYTVVDSINISKALILSLLLFAIVDILYLMPKIAVLFTIQSTNLILKETYLESSFIKIAMVIHTIAFTISILLLFKCINEKQGIPVLLIVSVLIFFIISFFLGRRFLSSFILLFLFIFYSVNRHSFNILTFSKVIIFFIIFYSLIFPFYNIIRNSRLINPERPVSTVIDVYNYGVENFRRDYNKANSSTKRRAIMLYGFLYDYIRTNPDSQNGKLTLAAIDQAIPRFLNPNKGRGTDPFLESLSRKRTDLSNSFLLHSYSDFHYWGIFLCYLLYLFSIWAYIFVFKVISLLFRHYSIILIIATSLFFMSFEVENKFEGVLANIIQLPLSILIILIVFRLILIDRSTELTTSNIFE